jgi:hypothetical protein
LITHAGESNFPEVVVMAGAVRADRRRVHRSDDDAGLGFTPW